ncbi:MAG: hypothetical protein GX422_18605 [Deltaproteobacteria bacterium]|nr:hypothetical protein [Deltaproteobacteria bacterium]
MSTVRVVENHFFIDLCARRVYCRSCGKACKSLVLPRFIQFWCGTRSCENAGDVKLLTDGTWQVFGYEETLHGNCLSEIVPKLLQSIVTGRRLRKP